MYIIFVNQTLEKNFNTHICSIVAAYTIMFSSHMTNC